MCEAPPLRFYWWLERKPYGAIAKVEDTKANIEKHRRTGRGDRAKLLGQLGAAMKRCDKVLECHDLFEQAMHRAQKAQQYRISTHGGVARGLQYATKGEAVFASSTAAT